MDKPTIEKKVCDLITPHCQFNEDKLSLDSDLRENYGIDSIVLVEILCELECVFSITIDDQLLTYDDFSTIRKISGFINNRLNGIIENVV